MSPPVVEKGSDVSPSSPILTIVRILIIVTLAVMKQYVLSICISLMTNVLEHLFVCLLAICMSFLGHMSVESLCPF